MPRLVALTASLSGRASMRCLSQLAAQTLKSAVHLQPIGRKLLPSGGVTNVRSHHAGQTTRMFKWQGAAHACSPRGLSPLAAADAPPCAESFWKATVYLVLTSIALRASIKEKCALWCRRGMHNAAADDRCLRAGSSTTRATSGSGAPSSRPATTTCRASYACCTRQRWPTTCRRAPAALGPPSTPPARQLRRGLHPGQAVPYLMLFEVARKDFWENVCHHAATLGLITYSYQVKCAPLHGLSRGQQRRPATATG